MVKFVEMIMSKRVGDCIFELMDELKRALMQRGFSGRQADVAILVSKGLTNKEVGERLFVCEKTVKFHLGSVFKQFKIKGIDIKSRSRLLVYVNAILAESKDGPGMPHGNA